jgi:hypothetical protein
MDRFTLTRFQHTDYTCGIIAIPDQPLFTLEPPWLENKKMVSCIPAGIYVCEFVSVSASGKFQDVWWVKNVPDRDEIMIHSGNYERNTEGCILIGMGWNSHDVKLIDSKIALNRLNDITKKQTFELEIRWDNPEEKTA